jgi:non-specific serine/threonine protein kinase
VAVVIVVVWFADEHRPATELLGPGDVFRSDDSGLWAAYEDPAAALAAAVGVAYLGSVGVHAGTVRATDRGYEGLEVNKAGRVAAAAMAGQVVVSSAAAALLGGVALPDLELAPLGEVPLPGVTEDEMLWTAVPSGESGRVSAGLVLRSRPGNLPGQLTTFVGRARELAEVVDLMRTNRLVTLTGPGGVGKTRLGLQAASDAMSRHRHGAWLVDLAEAQDPDLVPSTIAETLGLGVGQRDLLDELVTFLESRSVLLVVDNCEHVIDAVADTVHALLKGAPNLSVLATSRERLGIPGETPWTVPALELPDPETAPVEVLASSDAVALFTERAAIVDSQVALTEAATRAIAELCRRLDGIPLAIELAAARSATLTPSEILHELTDRLDLLSTSDRAVHPRHRTLGAVIDWSYQHLADQERTLLRRLSVFQAPPTLGAIRAVCVDGPLPAAAMVDHVEGLISKSMLARVPGTDPPRFRMLQTIRQYAHNQLAATGEEEAMHLAHAAYYLDLVRRAGAGIEASDVAWLHAVRLDMDNLRNVITWSLDSGDPAVGFEIAAGIAPVWEVTGQVHEALAVAERLLSTTASVDPRLLAKVAWVAGWARWRMGHLDHARDRLEKALDVAVSSQDHRTEALIRMTLGNIAYDEGDKEAALDAYRRGIEPAERASDALLHSKLLMNVGIVHAWLGQHAEEEEYYRRALGLQRSTGHRREEAWTLLNLGDMLVQRGDRNATALFSDALAIAETLGDRILEASALMELGSVAWRDEDLAAAREQLGTALRVFHEAGNTWNVLDIIWRLAGIAFTEGSHDSAALLIAAEAAWRRELGLGPPDSSHDLTALADRIRAAMSAEDYESAQLRAEALRLDEVVALALAV